MDPYLDLLKARRDEIDGSNKDRFLEYQNKLKAEQAQQSQVSAGLLSSAYDKDAKPYSLKALTGQPSATSQSIDGQPSETSQSIPQQSKPSATSAITNILAAHGADNLINGGSSAVSASTPAAPQIISAQAGAPGSFASTAAAAPFYVPGATAIGTLLAGKSGYDMLNGNPEDTSAQGKVGRGQLALTTMGGSELMRALGIGGGKGADQMNRDSVRKNLQGIKFLDDNFNVNLADGSKFDVGADGSVRNYNTDLSNPLVQQLVPLANPLATLMTGGDKKLSSDFASILTNAAMSNANGDVAIAKKNILAFYNQLGVSKSDFLSSLDKLSGKVDQKTLDIYKGDAGSLDFGPAEGQSSGSMPSFGGFKINIPATKTLPPPPPNNPIDFSLLNLAQGNQEQPAARGDVIFSNALKGILGAKHG